MDNQPPRSQTAENGSQRGARGRFLPGNKVATGNKGIAHKVSTLRHAMFRHTTQKEFLEISDKVTQLAKQGVRWACEMYFQYRLGSPVPFDIVERLEALEQRSADRRR